MDKAMSAPVYIRSKFVTLGSSILTEAAAFNDVSSARSTLRSGWLCGGAGLFTAPGAFFNGEPDEEFFIITM